MLTQVAMYNFGMRISWVVAVVTAAACARESREVAAVSMRTAPQTNWWCSSALTGDTGSCYRDRDSCDRLRRSMGEAGSPHGPCAPQQVAVCFQMVGTAMLRSPIGRAIRCSMTARFASDVMAPSAERSGQPTAPSMPGYAGRRRYARSRRGARGSAARQPAHPRDLQRANT
jgi:hypothetical protein